MIAARHSSQRTLDATFQDSKVRTITPDACPAPQRAQICMVMPHFGAWPRWFSIYLETCSWNPKVDWLFITDCEAPPDPPPNVRFVRMSLDELRILSSERLKVDAALGYAFKVCDFRPAFGLIFADLLEGYEFWGWGDTDVLYGDIRRILTDRILSRHDVISSRSGFLAGEFTLLRNSSAINMLFAESADHTKIFTTKCGFDFEEYGFYKDRPIDSMTHVVKRMHRGGKIRCLFDDLGRTDRKLRGQPFRFYWGQGQLHDLWMGEGILLYHFLDRKRADRFQIPQAPINYSQGLLITPDGVTSCDQPLVIKRRPLRLAVHRTKRFVRRLRTF